MSKYKNIRAKKLWRYLDILCDIPGDNITPPCVEREYNRWAKKVNRKNN